MDQFTISDMAHLSGVKAHTLRVWEQRYGILKPKRKASRHRLYDNEDLKYILRVAALNRSGIRISRIARLSEEELRALSLEQSLNESVYDSFIRQLTDAALDLDEERFNRVFQVIFLHTGMEKLVTMVFFPLLERLGTYWMNDQVRPVQEHFVSNLICRKLMVAINALELPRNGPVTILFNPTGEHHEIPILFIQYLLRKRGQRVLYFGADVDLNTINEYARNRDVARFHLHLITNFSEQPLEELVTEMLTLYPRSEIIASGPLTLQLTLTHNRLRRLCSLPELLAYCNQPVSTSTN